MEDIAISIEHVFKEYRLGAIGGGTLRGDLQSWAARKRGKEDPNSKIGSHQTVNTGERFYALKDISFSVKKGETLGIIGHNGAGKSTLLKLLSRVTAPTKGKISYNGKIASMLEVGTGFHPELTGRENVYMNGAILGMTKKEIDAKFDQIVEFAEMEQFIDTPVKRYSSGMYVKLAFSVAAHLDSDIMVMDEVLAVGDMKFQKKCLGRMGDASSREGRTILYVSHNMNTIRQLCRRCIVLDHGSIIFDGDTEKAISIYMDSNIGLTLSKEYGTQRDYLDIDDVMRIRKVSLYNKQETPVYISGENVQILIDYESRKDMDNLAFRVVLQTLDKIRVGLSTSKPCVSCVKGRNQVLLELPIDWLAPGTYSCFIVVYSVNEFGTQEVHDRVEDSVVFEKEIQVDDVNNITWNPAAWGYMMFPDLEILKSDVLPEEPNAV